jgi:prevent-host-death family protein
MAMQEFPAATLTRDPTALKEAARKRPVAITEYKRPRFVLMSYEDYLALSAKAADPRRSMRIDAMPDDLKALAIEALDQPYEA